MDPTQNPEGIGSFVGDRRRLTDAQRLQTLQAQLTDPARDPGSTAELQGEIARLQKGVGGAANGTQTVMFEGKPHQFPADATEDEIAQALEAAYPAPTAPTTRYVPSGEKATPSLLDPDMLAANPLAGVAAGAASPFLGALQVGGKLSDVIYRVTGIPFRPGEALDDYLARAEQLRKEGRTKLGSGDDFDWQKALGEFLSPAFLAMLKLPTATRFLPKLAQNTGLGAAAAASTPVTDQTKDFATEKGKQLEEGGIIGALAPAALTGAGKVAKAIYRGLIEPAVAPAAIKGRAFLDAAGDKADEIIKLLRQSPELVPGSAPTAGQAATPAGSAEFSALQRSAEGVKPSDYVARADAQNAARISAVQSVGKDKAALAAAEGERTGTANSLYEQAYATAARADPELAQLFQNPFVKAAVPDALELAKAGELDSKTNLIKFLHYVKTGLDKQLTRTGDTALSNTQRRAVLLAKQDLVDWMGRKSPAYDAARQVFAEKSVPINQMEVGQYLENKLVPALSDEAKQSSATYANALRDAPQTIKKATGGPRFQELTDVLTPEQVRVVESVRDDLARNARFDALASKGAKAGPNAVDLATANLQQAAGGKVPNILNRVALVANAIISRMEGKINAKLAAEIATEMLHPSEVGESLAKAKARAMFNARVADDVSRMVRYATPANIHAVQGNDEQP